MRAEDQLKQKKSKMANRQQKRKLADDLAEYFLAKAKIYTLKEYEAAQDKPVSFYGIRNVVGNYSKAVVLTKNTHPELEKLVEMKQKAEKLRAFTAPTPEVVKVEPAEVSAVIQDEDNE